MTTQYKITTTGTQSPVVFNDLGKRTFTHPTTDFDLMTEFSLQELLDSNDVQNSISLGYITVLDENDNDISNLQPQHSHGNLNELNLITDGSHDSKTNNPHNVTKEQVLNENPINNNDIDSTANISEIKLNLNYPTHAKQHSISSTSNHIGISGTEGNIIVINSSGLPVDSGYKPEDLGGGSGTGIHGLDSTSHIGISGTEDNFMSINSVGLPKDSGFSGNSFKRKSTRTLYVGVNQEYTTISSAITVAMTIVDSTTTCVIKVDPGNYNENLSLINNVIIIGDIGTKILGTVTANISIYAYMLNLYIENTNSASIIKSGTGTLYIDSITAKSIWTNDDSIQSVIDISNGTIYAIGETILTLEETSSYTSVRNTTIYNLNGSNQAQIYGSLNRHIINVQAANYNISIVHNTNTNSGNRVELLSCINTLTATHLTAPANRITLINHNSSLGYSSFDNNKTSAYAPHTTGLVYFIPAHCYNGSTWNTVNINKSYFQWADISDSNIYLGASTHSFNVLLLIDCYFKTATDIFPQRYTTDGSSGSLLYVLSNSYGSRYVSGVGGNVAITNIAQDITGGWTFKTGSPQFQISPVFANDVIWLARNSSGVAENVLWARATDNNTYMNYGSAGNFYLRNNSAVTQFRFNDSLFDIYNKDLNNIRRLSFEQRTSDVDTPDGGDAWYRYDTKNLKLYANTLIHDIRLVKVIQCYNDTAGNMNSTTPTAISWDGEDIKDDLYTHSTVTNNSRITVNRTALYRISYVVNTTSTARSQPRIRIRVNGTTYIPRSTGTSYANSSTDDYGTAVCSILYNLTANDYIEVIGDRSGSAATCNTIPGESTLQLELIRYT